MFKNCQEKIPRKLGKKYNEEKMDREEILAKSKTGQYSPTAKLALIICIALNKKFEEDFYF